MREEIDREVNELNINDVARKALALLIAGVEPLQGENIYDFVRRGEKVLKERLTKESAEEEEHVSG